MSAPGFSRLPRAFLPVVLALGTTVLLAGLLAAIPADFFLSKLQWDFLNYFLMAQKVVETGKPILRYAENWDPNIVTCGPAYFYAPAMALFHTFEGRLRAVQAENLLFLAAYLACGATYVRRVLPGRAGMAASILFLVAALVDSRTLLTAMLPNADVVPEAVTAAALLVMTSRLGEWHKLATVTALCVPAFFIKLSVIVLPLAASLIVMVRSDRRHRQLALAIPLLAALLFALYWNTVLIYINAARDFYLFPHSAPSVAAALDTMQSCLFNLLFVSLPGSVIPNSGYLFFLDKLTGLPTFSWQHMQARELTGIVFGSAVTATVLLGVWRLRRDQACALLALALALPPFALVQDGTMRYLVAFQPLLWCCLMVTILPLVRRLRWTRTGAIAAIAALVLIFAVAQNRYMALRENRLNFHGGLAVSQYFNQVAAVDGAVLDSLRQQPSGASLLIFGRTAHYISPVWSAASGIPTYDVHLSKPGWNKGKRVFLVISCRTPWCGEIKALKMKVRQDLGQCLDLKPHARFANAAAEAEIDEAVPVQRCSAG